MAKHLVVSRAFGDFQKGEHITDPKLVAQYAASHPTFVRAINVPDPTPEPPKAA